MTEFSTFNGLRCSRTGQAEAADSPRNLSAAGAPLFASYDLEKAARTLRLRDMAGRAPSIWRYHEVLPVSAPERIVTLFEGMSPLLAAPRLAEALGVTKLWVKDEGRNPTGSFKDRGMSVAISMARALGVERLVMPTAGNAGGAAAAYTARAGLKIDVFMPRSAPRANHIETRLYGASLTVVEGFLDECGRQASAFGQANGAFEISTFKEPYRVEGKKTMAYELVEQLGGDVPDVIVYPTGGGTGLVAMWKAFDELEALGWIGGKRPRMISVQAEGCAPIVKAYHENAETTEHWKNVTTRISGLSAPRVLADRLCLRAIRESGGTAIAVPDEVMLEFVALAGAREGLSVCPEGAACLAALPELVKRRDVSADESIVVFNTANANKYTDILAGSGRGSG
ncbi:MAG: threonine synthase [Proteobacteria bacterium]|nr:threonine synthase [Pseudomonadota bacterium]